MWIIVENNGRLFVALHNLSFPEYFYLDGKRDSEHEIGRDGWIFVRSLNIPYQS